jgi:HAD superfamily hydrolase (TIGR01458 family)
MQAHCFFYVHPNLMEEFDGISSDELHPTHIVIGDVGTHFSYQEMNSVFGMIMQGAEMIALQKNRFWLTSEGMKLDAGAFITALEYATGKTAQVFGKPSSQFFRQACSSLGCEPDEIVMIGDDLRADIQGGKEAGLQTIFVRTGKDKDSTLKGMAVPPDVVLNSIADLAGLF